MVFIYRLPYFQDTDADLGTERTREFIRWICQTNEVEILPGHVGRQYFIASNGNVTDEITKNIYKIKISQSRKRAITLRQDYFRRLLLEVFQFNHNCCTTFYSLYRLQVNHKLFYMNFKLKQRTVIAVHNLSQSLD